MKILYFAMTGLIAACGLYTYQEQEDERSQESCTVNDTGYVSCPDGKGYQLPKGEKGDPGTPGADGRTGDAGPQGSPGEPGRPGDPGESGGSGPQGPAGKDGRDGLDGQPGSPGNPGPVGPAGPAGEQGPAGEDGEAAIVIYDPCGDDPDEVDEIILEFGDGSLVAWHKNVGLVLLGPGTWRTGDKQRCEYTVHDDGSVSW